MNAERIVSIATASLSLALAVVQSCDARYARQETVTVAGAIATACQRSVEATR